MEEIIAQVNNAFKRRGERAPERIDRILKKLAIEWKKYPDMRLGQLMENLKIIYEGPPDLFYWEDEDLERALNTTNVIANTSDAQK